MNRSAILIRGAGGPPADARAGDHRKISLQGHKGPVSPLPKNCLESQCGLMRVIRQTRNLLPQSIKPLHHLCGLNGDQQLILQTENPYIRH